MGNEDAVQEEVLDTPESETGQTTESTEAETPTAEETEQAEAKEKTFTQKDVDEIVQKRLSRESRKIEERARLAAENEYLRQQLEQRQTPQQEKPSGPPKLEQFETAEDYIDALADYKLEQRMAKLQEQSEQHRQESAESEYVGAVRDKLLQTAEKYDDFHEVVDSIPADYVTPAMFDAIAESDVSGEISYYLGNNHSEAAKIAKMTPVQQVKAIDRLEAKLKGPKEVSKAPPPMETTGRGRAKTEPDLEKMSVSEYAQWRAKNGARWAR